MDETYVTVAGRWRSVFRAIHQFGQVMDIFVSAQRDGRAARRFFERTMGTTQTNGVEVVTDHAPVYPSVHRRSSGGSAGSAYSAGGVWA